ALRSLTATVALAIGLSVSGGCGGAAELPPPDLTTYTSMAIAPFVAAHDPEFGRTTARDLSTQLQIVLKRDVEGFRTVADETSDRQPVSDAIADLGITLEEAYAGAGLGGKVAGKLGVDILLIGSIREPKFGLKEDDQNVYDMTEFEGLSKGDTIFVLTYQQVSTRVWMKAVSSAGELVWQTGSPPPEEPGHITAYLKYARAHKLQAPERPIIPEAEIRTHLRDHIWRQLAHRLRPDKFAAISVPDWRELPNRELKGSGGIIKF
ncbi:MAG: hypothetical protein ABGY41_22020, partial [Candidatus Poribacteria bacterium]